MTRTEKWSGVEAAPRWIVIITGTYLVLGLLVLYLWRFAAPTMTVQASSGGTESLSVTGMAVAQVWLCLLALRSFRPGQPLRLAWLLIALSAAFRVASGLLVEVLGEAWLLNPLTWFGATDPARLERIRRVALALGGPLQMALLAAGLLVALRVLGQFGLRPRLKTTGWTVAAVAVVAVLARFGDAAAALLAGRQTGLHDLIGVAGAPVLCLLLFEALLLWRSAIRLGSGLIPKCWGAFAVGIFLTVFAEVALWALRWCFPAWPVASFEWYICFPAAAAFALAPAYQVAAVRHAASRAVRSSGRVTARRAFPRALPAS
jgi:hypothetical protein